MARRMTRAERKEAFLEAAEETFEELEEWYDSHEEASFEEIEDEARQRRRDLMGQALEILINGRHTAARAERPHCEECGAEMELKDYRERTVVGLEGDTRLERAYYVCPACDGSTFFPS